MVFIAPLPKTAARRPRVASQQQQQQEQQRDQTDDQQHAVKGSSSRAAPTAGNVRSQPKQQHARAATNKAGATGRAAASKSTQQSRKRREEVAEPDPQQLLAYQAALATQYLQREHAAQHTLQHSSSHLDLHNSSPQPAAQQQPHAAVVQTGASQACRADRQEQTQGWLVAEPLQQGRSPAKQRPVQQRQQQPEGRQQQQRQQPDVASLQQARASAAAVLPVQPKRSQNHMFWDVAPRTINPAQPKDLPAGPACSRSSSRAWEIEQVPGLMDDQPAGTAAADTPRTGPDATAAKQQQQQQQQHWQQQASTGAGQRVAAPPAVAVHRSRSSSFGAAAAARELGSDTYAAVGAHAEDDVWQGDSSSHQQLAAATPTGQSLVRTAADGQDDWQHGSAHQQQQQDQHPAGGGGDRAAELSAALRAAEQHPDPQARLRLIKDVKQQMYKLELEQQIAERDAARRASKAAAAAREAAEAAARAAAPPPWDPAAKMGRRGGGGEPLRGVDGAAVTDLRNQRHKLPVPGLDVCSSQTFGSAAADAATQPQPHQPPQQQQQPAHGSPSLLAAPSAAGSQNRASAVAGSSPGAAAAASGAGSLARRDSGSISTAGGGAAAAAAAGAKGFLGSMSQLRAGPSQEQRLAAAAARQQLQRDLEAQVAEKAARAQAQAAAEAARAAAEEAALQQYLLHKSSSQADVVAVGKEASIVYAEAGPLNAPIVPLQAAAAPAAASSSGSTGPALQRKGRSKRVIDAPWLDQLKQPQHHSHLRTSLQEQQLQLQQQLSQLQLPSHHTLPQQHSQQQVFSKPHAAAAAGGSQPTGAELWQETSQLRLGPGAAALADRCNGVGTHSRPQQPCQQQVSQSTSPSSHQLTAALQQVQQLQQEQVRMWTDFKQQAHELQQLLADKQAVACDRDAARAELCRLQELLQQQKQLQEAYASQQQVLLALQRQDTQQQQQQQQLGMLGPSTWHHQQQQQQQQQDDDQEGRWDAQDSLDAFVVETQMVPISANSLLGGAGDTQAVSDVCPPAQQQQHLLPPLEPSSSHLAGRATQHHGRNHKSRYSSFYGLEAELSAASVASQPRKAARTRVSGSFRPGAMAAAAAEGHPSVSSSLAASTSFLPFTGSSLLCKQELQEHSDQQQEHQHSPRGGPGYHDAGSPGDLHKGRRPAGSRARGADAVAAAAAAAAGRGAGQFGGGGSPGGSAANRAAQIGCGDPAVPAKGARAPHTGVGLTE